ncbi:Predicted E3 ubiquitin ligase, partial [Klebsormidium nitens]
PVVYFRNSPSLLLTKLPERNEPGLTNAQTLLAEIQQLHASGKGQDQVQTRATALIAPSGGGKSRTALEASCHEYSFYLSFSTEKEPGTNILREAIARLREKYGLRYEAIEGDIPRLKEFRDQRLHDMEKFVARILLASALGLREYLRQHQDQASPKGFLLFQLIGISISAQEDWLLKTWGCLLSLSREALELKLQAVMEELRRLTNQDFFNTFLDEAQAGMREMDGYFPSRDKSEGRPLLNGLVRSLHHSVFAHFHFNLTGTGLSLRLSQQLDSAVSEEGAAQLASFTDFPPFTMDGALQYAQDRDKTEGRPLLNGLVRSLHHSVFAHFHFNLTGTGLSLRLSQQLDSAVSEEGAAQLASFTDFPPFTMDGALQYAQEFLESPPEGARVHILVGRPRFAAQLVQKVLLGKSWEEALQALVELHSGQNAPTSLLRGLHEMQTKLSCDLFDQLVAELRCLVLGYYIVGKGKMGLEVLHKRGADAPAEPGGDATKPRKRFKVTPRRRVPGPVQLHSNGDRGAEHKGVSARAEPVTKKLRKANDPLKIWSSRERAVKAPCRERGWGGDSLNGGEDAGQSEPPVEEEDGAVHLAEEADGGIGGLSEEGSGVFLTAGLVDEQLPDDVVPNMTENEGVATLEKVQSAKALANDERPDKAYTTERARKNGLANASSGRVFVTSPKDHFGPITAAHDPVNRTGVRVGSEWGSRLECRQWGVHMPPVAGISGQSGRGAQSVVVSGGYEDDEDHGWYFIYTGSGGRDLSGNKRTSKEQSKEQVFEKFNLALKVSCREGYPVRVVRSHKERKSAFAPQRKVVRYDGIYRVEKCWRKPGKQNAVMCRFLFVRCDNEPPPWDSDGAADSPHRNVPQIRELEGARDVFERVEPPAWDWKEDEGCWGWTRDPPPSQQKAPKSARGNPPRALQSDIVKYDAPLASESGVQSQVDSGDDVSNTLAGKVGQAGASPTRETAAPALDTSAFARDPSNDISGCPGHGPGDVSGGADDVSVNTDEVGTARGQVKRPLDDVTESLGPKAPREGVQAAETERAASLPLEKQDGIKGRSGVKNPDGTMQSAGLIQAVETEDDPSEDERGSEGETPLGLSTPGNEADVGYTILRSWPRRPQFPYWTRHIFDESDESDEGPITYSRRRREAGVTEQSRGGQAQHLTPSSGSGLLPGELGVGLHPRAASPLRKPPASADELLLDSNPNQGLAQPQASFPQGLAEFGVRDEWRAHKKSRRRALRAELERSKGAKALHVAQLEGTFSPDDSGAFKDPPAVAPGSAVGLPEASADVVSRPEPPPQADVTTSSNSPAADVSTEADGVAAGGAAAAENALGGVTDLMVNVPNSPDNATKPSEAEFGEKALQTGTRCEENHTNVGRSGVTNSAAGAMQSFVTPEPVVELVDSPLSLLPQKLQSPQLPSSPHSKRAKAGHVAAVLVREPSDLRAYPGAEHSDEPVLVESARTSKADQSMKATGSLEGELQNGAPPELPPTPDQFEKARKSGQLLGQPGTRTGAASCPDFQPVASTAEPGTGVGENIARVILPATLDCETGASAGQLGTGEGQLEADRSLWGSPDGSPGEGDLERERKNPDRIVRELMRVARENEARCRKMENELQEARETVRVAEERAGSTEERALKQEETARRSEQRTRESEKQARDSEARTRSAEERARLSEELTRLVDERARGAEKRAQGAGERAQAAENRAWNNEMTGRALEKRARESEERAQEFEKRLRDSEAKERELEERLRVSEGFARALEAMKRETEERWAAEVVELKSTMERDREDFCEAAGCLLWGKDGSDGSMTSRDVTARGVVESVGALKGLVEELEGCSGKGTGGLIERARDQLLILRTDLGRKQEEVGMLEMMLDQSEQLREELQRNRGDGFDSGRGVESVQPLRECAVPRRAVAVQTDEPPLEPAGRAPRESTRADVKSDPVVVSGLRAELDELKQEYAALVGLIQRDRG